MFEGLFQPSHLILVLVVTLLMFGPGKLPQIGAGLGKSIRDFKKAISEVSDDVPPAAEQLPAAAANDTIERQSLARVAAREDRTTFVNSKLR